MNINILLVGRRDRVFYNMGSEAVYVRFYSDQTATAKKSEVVLLAVLHCKI